MLRQLKQAASKAMRHYSTNITAFRVHPTLATTQDYLSRSVISMVPPHTRPYSTFRDFLL
jgi:hypothetical protein